MTWFAVPIARVIQETPKDRSFVLRVPEGQEEAFRFRPGQYVSVRDPALVQPVARDYSLSSSPHDVGTVQITVRDVGRAGDHFYGCAAGSTVEITAPRGGFLLEPAAADRIVLAAGGSGVAPFRSFVLALRATGHGRPVTLIASARQPEHLVFDEEFRRHAKEASAWFRYVPTVSGDGDDQATIHGTWTGRRGRVDLALLREELRDPANTVLYACGPTAFVDAVADLAVQAGLPRDHLRRERWG
jgi:ferredoxin-NADP reductase